MGISHEDEIFLHVEYTYTSIHIFADVTTVWEPLQIVLYLPVTHTCFKSCLIFCFLRVIVMDKGHIVEMDSPSNLIAKKGQFYYMCREAGLL